MECFLLMPRAKLRHCADGLWAVLDVRLALSGMLRRRSSLERALHLPLIMLWSEATGESNVEMVLATSRVFVMLLS